MRYLIPMIGSLESSIFSSMKKKILKKKKLKKKNVLEILT